jgi:hypothetical protein
MGGLGGSAVAAQVRACRAARRSLREATQKLTGGDGTGSAKKEFYAESVPLETLRWKHERAAGSPEWAISNTAKLPRFSVVFLTHSSPGITVPRLANPDQKSGCRARIAFPPRFVCPVVGMNSCPDCSARAPLYTPRKRNIGTLLVQQGTNHRFECLSSTTKRAKVYRDLRVTRSRHAVKPGS